MTAPPQTDRTNPANLATALVVQRAAAAYQQGHLEAAADLAADVLEQSPAHLAALAVRANALREMGRFDEAIAAIGRILAVDPENAYARSSLALTLFYKEDWPHAWRAFDVRLRTDNPPRVTFPGADGRPEFRPPWSGGPPPASLLVMGEPNLSDIIQFARFLPEAVGAGAAAVTCVVPGRAIPLLQTLTAPVTFQAMEDAASATGIEGWAPLTHLPAALGLGPDQFAPVIPYLHPDPVRTAQWRAHLGPRGFKVGIFWEAHPDPRTDRGRSAPLSAFAAVADIPGIRLISLQRGHGDAQVDQVPFAKRIERHDLDPGGGLREIAALVASLDLVVTVDSSIAHLAGALGKPVFVLLKALGADWRWLYRRTDSVWYPTARLLRQTRPGDWGELLLHTAVAIRALIRGAKT